MEFYRLFISEPAKLNGRRPGRAGARKRKKPYTWATGGGLGKRSGCFPIKERYGEALMDLDHHFPAATENARCET